jgi:hypothetical protein
LCTSTWTGSPAAAIPEAIRNVVETLTG